MTTTDVYVIVHEPLRKTEYVAAFALDDTGELLETVEFLEDGKPDWEIAGICDQRGEDWTLQVHLRTLLDHMNAQHEAYLATAPA